MKIFISSSAIRSVWLFILVFIFAGDLLAMRIIPLPDTLRFEVGYDTGTLPGPEVWNRNVASSTNGNFMFTSDETPGDPLLASPPLAGQATQLSNGDLSIVIAGTNTQAGLQTMLELNDGLLIDRLVFRFEWGEPLVFPIVVRSLETSTDGGANYDIFGGGFESGDLIPPPTSEATFIKTNVTGFLSISSPPIDTGIRITLTAVPVPAAFWLFGSALGILGWARRRTS